MESEKLKKGGTYTYDEIKEYFKKAMLTTVSEPFGEIEDKELQKEANNPEFKFSEMLSAVIILNTMQNNLFE